MLRPWLPASLLCLLLVAPASASAFLPDTAVVLKVGDRSVRVRDYVETYYASWAEYRPQPDSAGRVQFLSQFVDKEVLASVARKANYSLGFEDRLQMRVYQERLLANLLFERMVLDSVHISDTDVQALLRQYSSEKHLKVLRFPDRAAAERVRADLISKRLTWKQAARRSKQDEVDLGWVARTRFDPATARRVFDLEPGQISEPEDEMRGVSLTTVVASRPIDPPGWTRYSRMLKNEIRALQIAQRGERLLGKLRKQKGLSYEDSNITWASRFFKPKSPTDSTGAIQLDMSGYVPDFTPEDTTRVLARWPGGQYTLGSFLLTYSNISPLMRPPAHTPEEFRLAVDNFVLEPSKAQMAMEMGFDKDPLAARLLEKFREGLLVERLYQDSIMTRVHVPSAEAHKYYDAHPAQYITFATVRVAHLWRPSQAEAESLASRIRAGAKGEDLVESDIAKGLTRSGVKELQEGQRGDPLYKPSFEELRPGQVTVRPDPMGRGWWAIQSLSFTPGKQLSYEEAERYVYEALENQRAEKLLQELLARHKRQVRIESHPELVMQIDLRNPTDRE